MNITVLGSTGSIGTQALNIIRNNKDKFKLNAISAHSNISLLKKQLNEFKPKYCVITDLSQKNNINQIDFPETKIVFGNEFLTDAAIMPEIDIVLVAVTGLNALNAVIQAIKANKRIALANKEIMVAAGEYVTNLAKEYKCEILPVDSEHSAIFQCLCGEKDKNLKNIILTASGGAFRDLKINELKNVTLQMALKHPNWNMGKKITIDSATLMNKGLEVIEARWFFNVSGKNIKCILHPQSIIHSMVEFLDNSVIAQMSYPSMEIPIQLSFTYPERINSSVKSLNFANLKNLEFKEIDYKKYPCLDLAYTALEKGNLFTAILNSANDKAVELFLEGKIHYLDIFKLIKKALNKFDGSIKAVPESVYYIDKEVKKFVQSLI